MRKSSGSEVEFQAKLDEAGVAHRIIDSAEARIVLDTTSSVRSAELGTVEEVEELGTELYVVPLTEICRFEYGEVPVVHAVLGKSRVHARLVAIRPGSGRHETRRVEPKVYLVVVDGGALIATGDHIRSKS